YFLYVLRNTLVMSFSQIIICFPVPIALAILFNEMRGTKLKRTLQTVYTFPHFLSWVVLSGIVISALDFSGPLNNLLDILGIERQGFLGNEKMFKPIIYLTQIWKEAGWSSITYLAAIVGIDMQYYEAADLDGASRFQKIWHITLPCIRPTILVLLILQIGTLMTGASFDQVFNLSNPAVQKAGDILDTYIYRITFQTGGDFSFSTAVGFFASAVNFTLVIAANWFSKKLDGVGILD
ncbi:MAG: sugar ABC transporter permease, partial [Clostridia bacterium]|nr:sugar ABC transporter permease [Clostridia bacterium]